MCTDWAHSEASRQRTAFPRLSPLTPHLLIPRAQRGRVMRPLKGKIAVVLESAAEGA